MSLTWRNGLAAASLTTAGWFGIGPAVADPLAAYRWTSRVLVIVAPTSADPRLGQQRQLVRSAHAAFAERNLVWVEGVGLTEIADALRRRFGIEPDDFRAILVGKDGVAKLSSATPLTPDRLFAEIDAMPMRRDEISRAARSRITR